MKTLLSMLAAAALMASAGGCAMCQSSFDDQYAAYGGSQPRADMTYGRVGSRFDHWGVSDGMPPEPADAWAASAEAESQ